MNNLFPAKKLFSLILLISLLMANVVFSQPEQAAPLLKKARDHLNLFHYDQARAFLKQAIQVDPQSWEAFYLAGKSFLKQKREKDAEKYLKKANDLNPDDLDCQKALGTVYIFLAKQAQKNGKHSEMVDYLHKTCRAYPGGTKIWETLFMNWWKSGDFKKIAQEGEFLAKSTKRIMDQGDDKNLQQALILVAKVHFRNKDFPQAEKYLDFASKIRQPNDELYSLKREIKTKSEDNAKKLLEEAQKEMDAGNYDKALEILSQAEKTSNSSTVQELVDKIQKELGIQKFLKEANDLRKANKYEEALEKLEDASMQFPEDERIANLMAVVDQSVEKIHNEQAVKDAKVIAEKRKRLDRAQKLRFYIKEGKDSEAEKKYDISILSYEKALKISPNNEEIKKKIASLHLLSKNLKEKQNAFAIAKTELENLVSSSEFAEAFNKGQAVIEEFEENKQEISIIMAEVCLRLEKYDEAKEFAISFEESAEHKSLYNYVRGIAAFHSGENDVALGLLQDISDFRPDISSTIWKIYLSKYQMGIYIFLLILLFPILKAVKSLISDYRQSAKIRKIERIRETGNYEANLAFLEERYEKDDCPNPKQIAVMLADALLRTGNPQRSYELVCNVLKRDGKNPHARRIAGEACLLIEETSPTGLEHIQNLYKMDESRKDVVEFLAKTYMRLQADHKLAQDFILKFISLNPGDPEATVFLADTYIKRQTFTQQTLKTFERAIKIAPDVPDYYASLIRNYRKLENHEEARKITEIAHSKFPMEADFIENADLGTKGGASKIGMRTSPAGFPDYDNIGSPAPASNGGGFPDYDNIGSPAPASNAGGFPDYDNIGSPAPASNAGGFPDYDSIGTEDDSLPPLKTPEAEPPQPAAISGPAKVCPHCQANNPVKEYYCATCGKPI